MEHQILTLKASKQEFKAQIADTICNGYKLLEKYPEAISLTSNLSNNHLKNEYNQWNCINRDILEYSFTNPKNKYLDDYNVACMVDTSLLAARFTLYCKMCIEEKISILEGFIKRIDLVPESRENVERSSSSKKKILSNEIFIVHGHSGEIKEKVARVLTNLGLDPIILHERPNKGKTIIEKLEANSSNVQFAVILLTADDKGKEKGKADLKSRARQNVILEMGYFMGILGRDCVFTLLENGVEKPGDLDGIVYTPIDSKDAWKMDLVKELKTCGYNITADKLIDAN